MKKRTLTLLIICCIFYSVGAQTGRLFTGGQIDFSTQTASGTTTNDFKFSPSLGYYLNDKFAVGLRLGYSDVTTSESNTSSSTTAFHIDPFIRYRFADWGNLGLIGEGHFDYSLNGYSTTTTYNGESSTQSSSNTSFDIGFRPGFEYKATDHLSFQAFFGDFGYSHEESTNKLSLGFGSDFGCCCDCSLGFIYYFR